MLAAKRRAVFLDRDGVINQSVVREGKPYPPASLAELVLLPGVEQALDDLQRHGLLLIVVTNQPDVATGAQSLEVVEEIHRHLKERLKLDDIRACYHVDRDACTCRKPKPGMLQEAAQEWGIDLSASYMVGDRWRDIEAGQVAGCRTYFIDYGYQERRPLGADEEVSSLLEASARIISHLATGSGQGQG
ncbi:MAG: HAD family hydrolase [Thermodesulfobacteriota bacterium]